MGGHPRNYHQSAEKWGVSGLTPKGGMLLFRALGGLWDEGRQGQKMKKFWKKISKILIVDISASEPSIEKTLKCLEEMGYPIISKQSDYFWVQ